MGTQALIIFTGSDTFETTQWQKDPLGNWAKLRILRRPNWVKKTRCTGVSAGSSCEECWDGTDCWAAGAESSVVSATGGSSGWTRFRSAVHVQCTAAAVTLNYTIANVRHGELRFFWDGAEIKQGVGFEVQGLASPVSDQDGDFQQRFVLQSRVGSAVIEVSRSG